MGKVGFAAREGALAMRFAGVGLVGFATDATVLHLAMGLGLEAAWARVISLFCAMQVTFVINGLHVFRCLDRKHFARQWVGYMTANGLGNFCNYWIFLTLISTHWPVASNRLFALAVGSSLAWAINFVGTRLLAFRKVRNAPAAAAPVKSSKSAPSPAAR